MRSVRFVCRLALPVVILVGAVLVGAADTASAQVPDVQQACTPDAMRLCGQFVPDRARVEACMRLHRREWSPGCRLAAGGGRRVARGYRVTRHHGRRVRHHHGY